MPWMTLIADLHGRLPEIRPDSYLLLLAGDIAPNIGQKEWLAGPFAAWLKSLPCPTVAVLGNHDRYLHQNRLELPWTLLRHGETCQVAGLTILGNGIVPDDRFQEAAEEQIEAGLTGKSCDILLSHCAPAGILDQPTTAGHVGSVALANYLLKHRPRLCVFGHAHEARGWARRYETYFVNATLGAGCNHTGAPVKAPHGPWGLADDSWQSGGGIVIPQPPPLEIAPPRSDYALATIVVGKEAAESFSYTRPYMEAYAERIGADFIVLDWPGAHEWPMSSKYAIPRVLDHYERVAYVDADVWLRPGCVNLFEMCPPDQIGLVDEIDDQRALGDGGREGEYRAFRRAMGRDEKAYTWMANCGVMVVPKSCRELLLPPTQPVRPYHCFEQDHTNMLVAESGKVCLMDKRANWQWWTGHENIPHDAVIHFSSGCGSQSERIDLLRDLAANSMEMDVRHVEMIRRVLMTGRYRRVLEIGCYRGLSTRAIVAAAVEGAVDEIHLIDTIFQPELRALIESAGLSDKVIWHQRPSLEALPGLEVDAALVDGCHTYDNVTREWQILEPTGVKLIIGHDINSTAIGYGSCEGAAFLRSALKDGGWRCTEDLEKRPGERTDRGLIIAER